MRIGTRFLAAQMRRWNGREDFVFAAYNAGPARVQRWRLFPEQADPERFVERIPYEETRDYVKRVSFHVAVYRRLYGDAPATASRTPAPQAAGAVRRRVSGSSAAPRTASRSGPRASRAYRRSGSGHPRSSAGPTWFSRRARSGGGSRS